MRCINDFFKELPAVRGMGKKRNGKNENSRTNRTIPGSIILSQPILRPVFGYIPGTGQSRDQTHSARPSPALHALQHRYRPLRNLPVKFVHAAHLEILGVIRIRTLVNRPAGTIVRDQPGEVISVVAPVHAFFSGAQQHPGGGTGCPAGQRPSCEPRSPR